MNIEELTPNKKGKGQADRLSVQHVKGGGVVGIFGEEALQHDGDIRRAAEQIFLVLKKRYPKLTFRMRNAISKAEIHKRMNAVDKRLGVKLFVSSASIEPDGRITEVMDKDGTWRVILVGESKHQGNDVQNIKNGVRTKIMEKKGQYIMPAGNAIERVHKNIQEMKNFMLGEFHFPYVVLLQGSNFATETIIAKWPGGPEIPIAPSDSNVNRIDRVTASNYGMEINRNYCRNMLVKHGSANIMLQVASIYAQCDPFDFNKICEILMETAETSLEVLADQLPAGAYP
jgi:type II restriction enzyme